MNLQHVAVAEGKEHPNFTVSPSRFCEFYLLSHSEYGFKAYDLQSGEEVARMSGTYIECRFAWKTETGWDLPHYVDRRCV